MRHVRLNPLEQQRVQRDVEHLHRLGVRAEFEFLMEVADRIGGLPTITGLLADYRRRLSPELLQAAGCDRFPPRPLHTVAT